MKNQKKKRTWQKITGITLLFIILAAGGMMYYVYHSVSKTASTIHTPIDRDVSEKRTEEVFLEKKDPFSVLLLGVDERKGDRGRSDTMIVMAVNPNLQSTKLLSIPRDTRTDIIGKGTEDKINHAWAFGGAKMSIETVENFLDVPIDYYIKINMKGFRDLVNAVDGVTVENDLDFTVDDVHFSKGSLNLDGDQALLFARARHEDPRGDFGRQLRQRSVIEAVLHKGASVSSVTNFPAIMKALSRNIETNLTLDQIMDIQSNYRQAASSIEQSTINETGTKINGIYYGIVSEEELNKVRKQLKTQLEVN